MIKKIKILLIKLKWILFGGKPAKEVFNEINEIRGIKTIKPIKRYKISNGNYASTKRTKK